MAVPMLNPYRGLTQLFSGKYCVEAKVIVQQRFSIGYLCIVEQLRTHPVGFGVGGKPAWGRQATMLLIRSSCSKMHFIQTPWLAVQCSGKFFDKKLQVPPRLTLGLGNEYFCQPQPSKRQKQLISQLRGSTQEAGRELQKKKNHSALQENALRDSWRLLLRRLVS